ncbi:YrzE family protein [Candidatus Nomurabacteria bacterium]|nr:YrzE family protein [Candidatus Nomurabacteria bacterium]
MTTTTVNLDNKTDGGFWNIFFYALTMVSFAILALYFGGLNALTVIIAILAIGAVSFFALGAEVLEPNEIGVYKYLDRFPVENMDRLKFTQKGGYVWRNPVTEKIVRFQTGLFTLDIEYDDLTMLNGDNAKGKVQLTLEIQIEYFWTLYEITGGSFDRPTIEEKVKKKLAETVPSRLGMAITSYDTEITDGYQFEEATKDKGKKLSLLLKKLLTTHHDEHGNVDPAKTDCFGLGLKSVEIPTPIITGTGYNTYKATKTSQSSQKLSEAYAAEYNTLLNSLIKKYKSDLGMSETDKITPGAYSEIRKEAERLLAQSKGNNPNYHEGLGGSKTFNSIKS